MASEIHPSKRIKLSTPEQDSTAEEMVEEPVKKITLTWTSEEHRAFHTVNSKLASELVESKSLKDVYHQTTTNESGISIVGPKGVGKSTALYYLLYRLKEQHGDMMVILVSTENFSSSGEKWIDYAKKVLPQELVAKCNWDKSVTDILDMILANCSARSRYLLIDINCTEEVEATVASFVAASKGSLVHNWKVILANSSGSQWMSNSKALTKVTDRAKTFLREVEMKPFTEEEAIFFLNLYNVHHSWQSELLSLAGKTPLMLSLFITAKTEVEFSRSLAMLENKVRAIVHATEAARIAGSRYKKQIADSLRWLSRASRNDVVLFNELKKYHKTYVAQENITYLVEEDVEESGSEAQSTEVGSSKNFKIYMAIPLALQFLLPSLLQSVSTVDLTSPIVQGFKLEMDFFQNEKLSDSQWKVRAKRHSDGDFIDLIFQSITCAEQQEVVELTKMEMNKVYYLKMGHPVIDAVCKAFDSKRVAYLILMQISLSSYADHKSKFEGIYSSRIGSKTIVDYYCSLSNIEKENVLYLYISPKTFLQPKDTLDVFNISSKPSRSGKKETDNKSKERICLCGGLVVNSEVQELVHSIAYSYSSN